MAEMTETRWRLKLKQSANFKMIQYGKYFYYNNFMQYFNMWIMPVLKGQTIDASHESKKFRRCLLYQMFVPR